MYRAYFNCGTSNTRLAIVDENLALRHRAQFSRGSKESALTGDSEMMPRLMRQMYDEGLLKLGIGDGDVGEIYASGMATSAYGIAEIPHIITPVDIGILTQSVQTRLETKFFGREIRLVPGVRTPLDGDGGISGVNNMRGEEIEIMGIVENFQNLSRIAVILPGSHTHSALVANGAIEDVYSCIWGELFYALKKDTVIGSAIKDVPDDAGGRAFYDEEHLLMGYDCCRRFGFDRGLYICHTMKVFGHGTALQRLSYFEGIITQSVADGVAELIDGGWKGVEGIVVAASDSVYAVYKTLLNRAIGGVPIFRALARDGGDYSLDGFRRIVNNSRRSEMI